MKRAILVVGLMLAACGGADDGDADGMTGEAYCCDDTFEVCDAGIAGDGRCFYANQGCSPDGGALCVRGGTGPVCTRGNDDADAEAQVIQRCRENPGSCPENCVVVAIIAADKDGTPTRYDHECIAANDAAGCF